MAIAKAGLMQKQWVCQRANSAAAAEGKTQRYAMTNAALPH